jgi:hypothetical protein
MTRLPLSVLVAAAFAVLFTLAPNSQAQTIKLETRLTAPNGGVASGKAKYEDRGTRRKFSVEAQDVRLANGTVLSVCVNGQLVGTLRINFGRGDLNLDTALNQAVPVVRPGSVVEVKNGATVIVRGTF